MIFIFFCFFEVISSFLTSQLRFKFKFAVQITFIVSFISPFGFSVTTIIKKLFNNERFTDSDNEEKERCRHR